MVDSSPRLAVRELKGEVALRYIRRPEPILLLIVRFFSRLFEAGFQSREFILDSLISF